MNMEDPKVQEDIRRKPHEYVATEGRHGMYREKPYVHQDYPKMMLKAEAPKFKDFKGKPDAQALFDAALKEWDQAMTASIVHNKAQEAAWLREHAA